jgi:DNA-binding MarR family transcriptional regulator
MTETWRARFPLTSFMQDVLQKKVAEVGLSALSAPERVLLTATSLWSAAVRNDLRAWFSRATGDRIQDAVHALSALGAARLASIVRAQADFIASRDSDDYFRCVADLMLRCDDEIELLAADYAARFLGGIELQDAPLVLQGGASDSVDAARTPSLSDELDDLLEDYKRLGDTLTERIAARGLDLRCFVVLGFISEAKPQTLRDLAVLIDLSLSSTRRCVDELAAQGLVQMSPGDETVASTISITARGTHFLDQARHASLPET